MSYSRTNKNMIREFLVPFFKKRMARTSSLLTLETSEWLFVRLMKSQRFRVFQNDLQEFKQMKRNKPKNVTLVLDDVNNIIFKNKKYKGAYLDYCNTFKTNWKYIKLMLDSGLFHIGSPIAFTFSTRGDSWKNNLVTIRNHGKLNIVTTFHYNDTSGMVTVLCETV